MGIKRPSMVCENGQFENEDSQFPKGANDGYLLTLKSSCFNSAAAVKGSIGYVFSLRGGYGVVKTYWRFIGMGGEVSFEGPPY